MVILALLIAVLAIFIVGTLFLLGAHSLSIQIAKLLEGLLDAVSGPAEDLNLSETQVIKSSAGPSQRRRRSSGTLPLRTAHIQRAASHSFPLPPIDDSADVIAGPAHVMAPPDRHMCLR